MLGAIALALITANSPLAPYYEALHHAPIHIRLGPLLIERPLAQWINQGLMVFFFLLVGLEIKRQFLEGHLSDSRHAMLPVIAAIGGMAAPALIYVSINWSNAEALRGWAIPTATDIVLAIGILALLRDRVPVVLRVFLTALAIFDDIGAVLVIGVFYGEGVHTTPLIVVAGSTLALLVLNRLRATWVAAYVLIGLVLWVGMLKSGVDSALAGVVIGLAVPIRVSGRSHRSPLRVVERHLHPWCAIFIVPLFAFFNAGISFDRVTAATALGPVAIGVALALIVGKPLGIVTASWIGIRLGVAALPPGLTWNTLIAVAPLAGIGFTLSLFVSVLAFRDPAISASARLAILTGSTISAVIGLLWLHLHFRRQKEQSSSNKRARQNDCSASKINKA